MEERPVARIVLVGCFHSGSKSADINRGKRYIDIANEKNTYLGVLGDLFENAIPARGEGMVWEQNLTPEDQIEEMAAILYPVKDKILFSCTSNHSERTYKEVGIDLDRQLYKRLGVPHVYKGLEGIFVFRGHKIAFSHGGGSGENWNDAHRLLKIYPQADIIATSHRHEMASKWHGNQKVDHRGYQSTKYVLFARTGGVMNWARYARRELYSPQKPGFTIINFYADGTVDADTSGRT